MTNALNLEADFGDQTGFFNPRTFGTKVVVIGCGGIGASIIPTLVTMGVENFELYDGDSVEPRNVTTNLIFRRQDIGRLKVERVEEYLKEYGGSNVTVTTHDEHYTGQEPLSGIVISGVDSMAARHSIWGHVSTSPEAVLYLDGRIGGLQMTLLSFQPFDPDLAERYETHYMGSDEDAAPLPCTQRTIVHPAVTLGSYMAEYLRRWSRGEVARIPFMTTLHFGDDEPFFQVLAQ